MAVHMSNHQSQIDTEFPLIVKIQKKARQVTLSINVLFNDSIVVHST